jgi:hypothetical protein
LIGWFLSLTDSYEMRSYNSEPPSQCSAKPNKQQKATIRILASQDPYINLLIATILHVFSEHLAIKNAKHFSTQPEAKHATG